MLLQWDSAPQVKNYRVEIAATNSFSSILESTTTDLTAWAPKLTHSDLIAGGKFYWRVASIDEGSNLGGFAATALRTSRQFQDSVYGVPTARSLGSVQVLVTNARAGEVRKAKVVVSGAGLRRRAKRTGRDGAVIFKLRPRHSGTLTFRVTKRGYRPAVFKARVPRSP
jgi:hypothetical protein